MKKTVRGQGKLIFPTLFKKTLTTARTLSLGEKLPEGEADRPPPSSAEVKKI
jgi:hypothetical protein